VGELESQLTVKCLVLDSSGPVHTTPEEIENATITSHFGFVFEETSLTEIA